MANYGDSSTYSTASGKDGLQYVVLQVTLKEKFLGTGSGNLSALEEVLNEQAANYEKEVLRLVNVERSKENLQALNLHSKLSQATAIRANELVESFSHTRPSGERCFTVFKEVGIASYYACGENIAAGQKTPEQVVSGWMSSPGHRANILSAKYRYMGIGYVETTTGMKRYWAQMFMS